MQTTKTKEKQKNKSRREVKSLFYFLWNNKSQKCKVKKKKTQLFRPNGKILPKDNGWISDFTTEILLVTKYIFLFKTAA